MRPVTRHALVHRPGERLLRPGADAGLGIGRNVGGVDHAKWGRHGIAACERLSAFRGMALRAIAGSGERLSLRDQRRFEGPQSGRRDRRDCGAPGQGAKSQSAEDDKHNKRKPQLLEQGSFSEGTRRLDRMTDRFTTRRPWRGTPIATRNTSQPARGYGGHGAATNERRQSSANPCEATDRTDRRAAVAVAFAANHLTPRIGSPSFLMLHASFRPIASRAASW